MQLQQDEIIEMARQAGIIAIHTEGDGNWHQQFVALEAFAKLVSSKAIEAEREACLKICEQQASTNYWEGADVCAEDIRARGSNE